MTLANHELEELVSINLVRPLKDEFETLLADLRHAASQVGIVTLDEVYGVQKGL
jgi:hypothetical protein